MSRPFDSVLVANRGEIAVRVIRTLRRLGVRSVAVYSEADRAARHVAAADQAVLIGPADARSSYLDVDRVVAAAVTSGAQAVHPGYGFLSENAAFAEACRTAGLVFVGPDPQVIRLMGDKRGAKESVAALGVPVVPGFHDLAASDETLAAACAAIGFPVIVKPSAGGGGKGMRVVDGPEQVAAALTSARREALAAFGDDTLLVERYLPRARHVEVQVMGGLDAAGAPTVLHLGDRDCSLQRRHQKVVEEAPAPFLPAEVRQRMHDHAVAVAGAVGYQGAGTVEFVVDADDPATCYFLEMNTRLQVEHPVTELVTGLDLVELQLRVAAGQPLPLTQQDVRLTGHAVEARVYAEDGHHGFLPASGTVLAYDVPGDVRVDSGIAAGSEVGTSYDPLLLKVVAAGSDRATALDALDGALARTVVTGLAHNIGALRQLVTDPEVRAGRMTTGLLDGRDLGARSREPDPDRAVAAALLLTVARGRAQGASPWTVRPGWRVGDPAPATTALVDGDGRETVVSVLGPVSDCLVAVDDAHARRASVLGVTGGGSGDLLLTVDGSTRRFVGLVDDRGPELVAWVGEGGDSWSYRQPVRTTIRRPDEADIGEGELRSPMPGSVVVVPVAVGQPVREGDVVVVVEAMKMEYPVVSPVDGTLVAVGVSPGAQVTRDQVLAVVAAAPEPDAEEPQAPRR